MTMTKNITPKENSLPPAVQKLDPILKGVHDKFNLNEEFRVFLDRNEDIRNSRPDIGFLLFLIEQHRETLLNLEQRLAMLEQERYVDRHIPKPQPPIPKDLEGGPINDTPRN